MRPHHDWSDVLQLRLVHSLVLGKGHESPVIEVLGDRRWVIEEAEDLGSDFLREAVRGVSRSKNSTVKAVWS